MGNTLQNPIRVRRCRHTKTAQAVRFPCECFLVMITPAAYVTVVDKEGKFVILAAQNTQFHTRSIQRCQFCIREKLRPVGKSHRVTCFPTRVLEHEHVLFVQGHYHLLIARQCFVRRTAMRRQQPDNPVTDFITDFRCIENAFYVVFFPNSAVRQRVPIPVKRRRFVLFARQGISARTARMRHAVHSHSAAQTAFRHSREIVMHRNHRTFYQIILRCQRTR